jgi:hypothetical protein
VPGQLIGVRLAAEEDTYDLAVIVAVIISTVVPIIASVWVTGAIIAAVITAVPIRPTVIAVPVIAAAIIAVPVIGIGAVHTAGQRHRCQDGTYQDQLSHARASMCPECESKIAPVVDL